MKLILLSLIVLLTCSNESQVNEQTEKFPPVVVLELFTSQGCSSCPPADNLLNEVKKSYDKNEVIVLSYHVDYWNYIGWKDPFSTADYTDKQRQYSQKFNSSSIYTPQLVVNGQEHFVGSNESILKTKLKSYLIKNASNTVTISNIKKGNESISFDYNIEGNIAKKQLRIALVIEERTTSIARGENKNRSLKNSNIVVAESKIDLDTQSGKATISVPKLVNSSDKISLINLIQTSELDIVGGSQVKL